MWFVHENLKREKKKEEEAEAEIFTLGGTLTLKPAALTSSISSITWKHNDNLLAEQLNKESPPDYYPPTEKRISLNFKTGELSIIKLTEKDAGKYNVEINTVIQNVGYQVKIIKRVPVPTVVVQPLACSETSPNCSLDCQGDVTGAGTVRYFWKEDDGDWKESAKKKEIKNDVDMQTIKEFFCKVKNSVSDEESLATKNPFYKETRSWCLLLVCFQPFPMGWTFGEKSKKKMFILTNQEHVDMICF
uniref:Ig-like domain-containing protein n=1 Tax=Oryzias sinensis TaxID=183150 RepID=A0A8C8DEC3_9TELE